MEHLLNLGNERLKKYKVKQFNAQIRLIASYIYLIIT